MADVFSAFNGVNPTTAISARVTTGTAIKTMLQISTPTTRAIKVLQWWVEFDGVIASNPPVQVELLHTDVAATVTTLGASGIVPWQISHTSNASQCPVGTAASGFTSSAEGTIADAKVFEVHHIPPTGGLISVYPLGREPVVPVSRFLRIRLIASVAINCYCGIVWEE